MIKIRKIKGNLIAGVLILLLAILQVCFILYDVNEWQSAKLKDTADRDHMIISSIDDVKILLADHCQDVADRDQRVLDSIDDMKMLLDEIVEASVVQTDNERHCVSNARPKREQSLARLLLAAISMREALLKGVPFTEQIQQSKLELIALSDSETDNAIFELEKLHEQKINSLAELKIKFYNIQENLNEPSRISKALSPWVKITKKNDKLHQLQPYVEGGRWDEVIELVKNTQNVDLQNWAQQLRSSVTAGRDVTMIYNKVVQLISRDSPSQNIG